MGKELLERIVTDASVCAGHPCIRGSRILVASILDGLAEGLSIDELIDHYPSLKPEDVRASGYGAELARETVWKS
jgi:uncharacterized protein (DUF433 family)